MGARVLVVDDAISSRGLVRIILENSGYECTEAVDGVQALELLRNKTFDLVITDHWMPNMTGIELVGRIREESDISEVPVLAITTDEDVRKCTEFMDAGATGCMRKPFGREGLLDAVQRLTAS
jgi:two-component system chemotaxis response regulator CheY